ncbi:aspartate kinase [Silvanigrella aquatica]|uniref:Aspartokinase n=1 Tax=Silvanigrella aquatica TaxID=1915309 RepID=A0A1L4D4P8_9BACT|nr:aspartate kinase [Silvanigrella aquatica]
MLGPVFKFGGTSLGSVERIEHVANLCLKLKPSAVVVSAMSGETNRLVAMANEISTKNDVPEYDMLVASGEQVSVSLLSLALRKRGIEPAPMLAPTAGILTDSQFSKASILKVKGDAIQAAIAKGHLPIIAGFQGVTEDGRLTSLGRGGSDTSAVAIAAGIGAKECIIYTDVDGVFTTDPRICPDARIIRSIHYEEMLEMASQGSKVLHIRSVQLAAKWGIRLVVRNSFSNDEGTEMSTKDTPIEGEVVSGVAATQNEAWIQAGATKNPQFHLASVFSELAEKKINVDIITQSYEDAGTKINFTVAENDAPLAIETLKTRFPQSPLSFRNDVAKISIVGVGMRTHAGVAARMFQVLAAQNIEILLVTTSEIKVGCLIPREKLKQAVQVLHKEFLSLRL